MGMKALSENILWAKVMILICFLLFISITLGENKNHGI